MLSLSGASAWGAVPASGAGDMDLYDAWLARGDHAAMGYMERNNSVRADARLLLEGARTVIVALFNYNPGARAPSHCRIADYALGHDYHEVVRARLGRSARALEDACGGVTRVCVDTAPLRERWWARRAGLGWTGLNGQLIRPGHGAHYIIGTLLWTGTTDVHDRPLEGDCGRCGLCVKACPARALDGSGGVDARRCLSYLTIESRDPLPDGMCTQGRIFGCDTCRLVCPHEVLDDISDIDEFKPRPGVATLTPRQLAGMSQQEFSTLFSHSAVKRAKLTKLLDTLGHL